MLKGEEGSPKKSKVLKARACWHISETASRPVWPEKNESGTEVENK